MRVAILYRSNTDHERSVIDFDREYGHRTGRSIEMLDLNTRDGSSMATLYDIVQYPAILAIADDGRIQQVWQGENLPLIDEVSYYGTAISS